MHHLRFVTLLAVSLCSPLFGAGFTMEKAAAPEGAPEAAAAMVAAEGVTVKNGDTVVAQYWGRKDAFEGSPSAGFGIRYGTIPEGAFLALVHFPEEGHDFREQGIPAGWYTLRYALHPEDGNHMGVAPSRDFSVLSPAAQDDELAKNYKFADLVELTKKVGNPHPTVERIELPEGSDGPNLWEDDYGHWVLDLPIAGEVVGIVVYGHSEE
ncbi:MAG: hypothetical protein KDC27_04510 [Acidobacteria bacterium]|nr:hypothetical protein [Acidobacteriota bacterium]